MSECRTEYRITGRFRKDEKRHIVDCSWRWTKEDAERRLRELEHEVQWEMEHKRRKSTTCGMIGISTEYYSDYDLLELRIESREVTKWKRIS